MDSARIFELPTKCLTGLFSDEVQITLMSNGPPILQNSGIYLVKHGCFSQQAQSQYRNGSSPVCVFKYVSCGQPRRHPDPIFKLTLRKHLSGSYLLQMYSWIRPTTHTIPCCGSRKSSPWHDGHLFGQQPRDFKVYIPKPPRLSSVSNSFS